MKLIKWLSVLGVFTGVGVVLTLAYASRASQVRQAFDRATAGRAEPVAGGSARSVEHPGVTTADRADRAAQVHAEHVLEHGIEGRARSEDQAKKPHVRD